MKRLIIICLSVILLGSFSIVNAQESVGKDIKTGAKKTGKVVKKGAKKTGNKTAEVATKGKAKVTHTVYKQKMGPNGEVIYIATNNRYYWIDKKGRKHYVPASALKNKID